MSQPAEIHSTAPSVVATENPALVAVARAEEVAAAKVTAAHALAQAAAASHQGYEAAFAAIDEALTALRVVRGLATQLLKSADEGARVAAPGILRSVGEQRASLESLHGALAADQAMKRPELAAPSAPGEGRSILPLAAVLVAVYALARYFL